MQASPRTTETQHVENPLRCSAVPQVGNRVALAGRCQGVQPLGDDLVRIEADEAIRALRHGDRAFGVLAHRQTGNAELRRFFLHAAGIGQHQARVADQFHEIEIAERLGENQIGQRLALVLIDDLARARMHREHEGNLALEASDRSHQPREYLRLIDVGRPMHRQDRVPSGLNVKTFEDWRACDTGAACEQCVDHHIADEMDAVAGNVFRAQVCHTAQLGDEQPVADRIGEDAIDLFGHRAIEAAQASLDVRDRNAELDRGQGARQRRVHVADDEDDVRFLPLEHWLEAFHNFGRLHGVRTGADFQILVRGWDLQLGEKTLRHLFVVVLAGVDEERIDVVALLDLPQERGDLHEVGPGAGDQ